MLSFRPLNRFLHNFYSDREQMIIFVYDTGFCQTEADDPQKAVLFFHPHWVSDQQRLALCGQLMGAAHFCSSVFSSPRVLTLQCGKFVLKKFGRYILSVGSDQTLPEWILQERFNTLELLIQFYHQSFDSIYNTVDCNQETFSKRLTEVLEIYIPILQFIVCAPGNVFLVRCPKKNSFAFLEAFQLLESCCSFKGVLGGVILHNSRVIATQLDPDITKILALTDRFHTRMHAEEIKTPFYLPVGVQLIKVHLSHKVYETLHNSVNLKSSMVNGVLKKNLQKAVKKKKDLKKIFTVHEEEDVSTEMSSKMAEACPESSQRLKTRKSKSKTETNALKERSKSFVGGLNIKVCSTPTVEKTLIHEELVSICSSGKTESKTSLPAAQKPSNFVPDIVQDAIRAKTRSRMLPSKYSINGMYRMSMDDLMVDFSHKAYPVLLRYYSFGLPKMCREVEPSTKENRRKRDSHRRNFYKTIADPMNPVFRHDGIPVSKSLYNHCLDDHYKDFITANRTIDSREEFLKSKYLETENFERKTDRLENSNQICDKENSFKEISEKPQKCEHESVEGRKEPANANHKAFRRSLSLPLKPLFCDTVENTTQNPAAKTKVLLARTPTTPLTTKLGLLAFEEQIDPKPLPTPVDNPQLKTLMKNISTKSNRENSRKGETVPSSLFVRVHQTMTILLILDEDVDKNPDLILSLWEMSSGTLKKLENLRSKSVANISTVGSSASYSFLSMDSRWGTTQRSGPWGDDELKIVGSLHDDLVRMPKITEIIIRNEDSVVYGYSCGGSKIFYQQGGCSSAGLPTPADLMGVVTLKARRRLERDRDIVLL